MLQIFTELTISPMERTTVVVLYNNRPHRRIGRPESLEGGEYAVMSIEEVVGPAIFILSVRRDQRRNRRVTEDSLDEILVSLLVVLESTLDELEAVDVDVFEMRTETCLTEDPRTLDFSILPPDEAILLDSVALPQETYSVALDCCLHQKRCQSTVSSTRAL
jgi:hypothetical protein